MKVLTGSKLALRMRTLVFVFSIPCTVVGVFLLLFEPYKSDTVLANIGRALVVAAVMVPVLPRYQR